MDSKCRIQVFGGMSKGLPLANAVQSGLLMDGTIQQAWGNWQGTEQNINFVAQANSSRSGNFGTPDSPVNLVLN
jgi:hypothetical protein